MRNILIIVLMGMFLIVGDSYGQKRKKKAANQETTEWRYEVEPEGISHGNSKSIRVWSYSKKVEIAREQATKNAVHGIIFRGVNGDSNKRVAAIMPLIKDYNAMEKNSAFFNDFFADGGQYRQFATTTEIADKIRKLDRKTYKVGVVVNVQYDALRKMLEQKGIIKSLSSGF